MEDKVIENLTDSEKSLLLALCIGDGCLRKPTKRKNVQFECAHSEKQLEYLTWKRDLVYQILGGYKIPKIGFKDIKLNGYDKIYKACRFTKTHPYFTYLRKILYPKGIKIMNRKILNMLTPQGIAIWYMDDGSFYKKDNASGTKSICFDLRISTDSFTKSQNEEIAEYFKEVWGINFKVFKSHKEREHSWILRANKEAAIKFIDLIKPYVLPSMSYKIEYKDNNFHESEASINNIDEDIVRPIRMIN